MQSRREVQQLTRKLDWQFSYVDEKTAFPQEVAGNPWLANQAWQDWEEPFRTSYAEYVKTQHEKDAAVFAVQEATGRIQDFQQLDKTWLSAMKLHAATLPLAEFAAVVGNMRAARFARDSAWRNMATFGALDELRHTQIPLLLLHELLPWDAQFDWTHRFYHTNNWIAIAARHFADELLLASDPIEFAIGTNFVFETGFTNLQFIGLSSLAEFVGDRMFEKMVTSIQTDEARHAQIGRPVLLKVMEHDPQYAQYLLDKWFWRSWLLFAIVTGFGMDYFTPLEKRQRSFKEFMQEWVLGQYLQSIESLGLKKPWYWDFFLDELEIYHHMVYASAYTYRATTWFPFVVPGPEERAWLAGKYPRHWDQMEKVWKRIHDRWENADIGTEWGVHGATPVAFCDLCQIVLSQGTPKKNPARLVELAGKKYMFCSDPCQWIFEQEPQRYQNHKDVVKRILAGEAPPNVIALVHHYMSLDPSEWGKDLYRGAYPWLRRPSQNAGAL